MSDYSQRRRVVIMGAAGRDFHHFLCCYRDDLQTEVVAFTVTQIPGIAERRYPASLAGPYYPDGIPIYPETDLERLIIVWHVDEVVLPTYSGCAYAFAGREGTHKAYLIALAWVLLISSKNTRSLDYALTSD